MSRSGDSPILGQRSWSRRSGVTGRRLQGYELHSALRYASPPRKARSGGRSPRAGGADHRDGKEWRRWRERRAGLEDVRFHDLRHTCASHLVMSGADIKVVQEILGHHSLVMTQRYAHLAKDHRTRAIRNLDRALHCSAQSAEKSDTKSDTVEKVQEGRTG